MKIMKRKVMEKNNVIIAGIYSEFIDESFYELESLCKTLSWNVIDRVFQKRKKPDARFYFGRGFLEKFNLLFESGNIDYLIINDDLTIIQRRNIERTIENKVYDRTELILEIFAKHAKTKEGKLQVEIARLKYLMSYLVGKGKELSRLGGGIGTRGPGETKLEYTKRYLKKRVSFLEKELYEIRKNRDVQRKKRIKSNLIKISIVGYTNAGKTTLLSALSKDLLYSKNEMFSTVSPITRRVRLPSGAYVLFSDTVGFIKKLHPLIVEAFHSTLEEIVYSDLILILVDASDINFKDKIKVIFETLEELGIKDKKMILVFNKIDLCNLDYLKKLKGEYKKAIFISARKKINLDLLLYEIDRINFKEV
ncbi:GTP-binding protein [Thermosipho affectus]|uniref:GTPase HflX n=2 Tax=Thermosipho affectus TaxID=660294 RepID=A0ABX3ILI2_9BACT|nr:GTP-binding protein [Thermosipho affectus]